MKRVLPAILAGSVLTLGAGLILAQGQGSQHGMVIVPDSTIEHAADIGVRAHTNHLIFFKGPSPAASSPSGLIPSQVRAGYNLPTQSSVSPGSGGGGGVIAIVDAYDYPTAQSDFDTFSNTFGLPTSTSNVCNGTNPCFTKVYATGSKPRTNCGWAQEEALDIEWSHAMAPYAQIVLVEAKSNSFSDLFFAIAKATQIVTGGGYPATATGTLSEGEVSMSWGGSEFSSESSYDSHFTSSSGVVYFASSGDTGGKVIYPSASPDVVSAGGTTLNMSGNTFVSETAWSSGGGGPSQYEAVPTYQSSVPDVSNLVGTQRGTPDFSFDANPSTGVSVYDSTSCQGLSGWLVFGGTSVSSPSLSGIVNSTGHFYSNSTNELSTIYSTFGSTYGTDYRDITVGSNGYPALTGWDFATGVGSDLGLNGK